MSKVLTRPKSGAVALATITPAIERPVIYADHLGPSTASQRQRVAVEVEPFWKIETPAKPAASGDDVIEPMVSLDVDGRPLVELRAYDAEQLGKRLIAAARAALEG